jgi:hypothetical protein
VDTALSDGGDGALLLVVIFFGANDASRLDGPP